MSFPTPTYDAYITSTYKQYPEDWKPLTKDEAEELFKQHACLFFDRDCVPYHIGYDLFGYAIMEEMKRLERCRPGEYGNACGLCGVLTGMVYYLNKKGFQYAVSLANALPMVEIQKPAYDALSFDADQFEAEEDARRDAAREKRRERAKARKEAGQQQVTCNDEQKAC